MNRIGEYLGSGGCSEVFEWGNEKVIKLIRSNKSRDTINLEYSNSIAAWESGLPVARPYEQVDIDGRFGIIFEKIIGDTIKDRFFDQLYQHNMKFDDEENDIRIIARILYEIHNKSVSGILTNQKDSIKRFISWSEELSDVEKLIINKYLDHLPSKNKLCHGDPNPGNVIMRNGKPVMIDWMNATIGNPAADIVEFIIMIKYYVLPTETPTLLVDLFNASRETVNEIFLDEYMKLSGLTYEEIDAWILPVAARKLSSDMSEAERNSLINEIRRRLKETDL